MDPMGSSRETVVAPGNDQSAASGAQQAGVVVEPTLDGAFSDDGVDLTLIRWMLRRSPTERLRAAQDLVDTVWALRTGSET